MKDINNWFDIINTALFHNVSTQFFAVAAVCVVIIAVTVVITIHEIRHDIS